MAHYHQGHPGMGLLQQPAHLVHILQQMGPAVRFPKISPGILRVPALPVGGVVTTCHEDPLLVQIAGKGVVAPDMLAHPMDQLHQAPGRFPLPYAHMQPMAAYLGRQGSLLHDGSSCRGRRCPPPRERRVSH